MTKSDLMKQIRDELLHLTESPLYEYRQANKYFPVIGEGSHDAKIVFIGEAPGKNEAQTARPFCGASGKVLDELLASIKLERSSVYITNIVKDRPMENRDPLPAEIALYGPFLDRQLEIIKPKVVATLGRFSLNYILEKFNRPELGQTISTLHGTVIPLTDDLVLVPLYHPAASIYNQKLKETLIKDFQVLKGFI